MTPKKFIFISIPLALVIIYAAYTFQSSGVRVEEYVPEGTSMKDIGYIRLFLKGQYSWRHIPFLLLRYKEVGPYEFGLTFFCHDGKPYDEITITSINLLADDNTRFELYDDQLPDTWNFETRVYNIKNPAPRLTSIEFSHTFKTKLDIPFEQTQKIYVTIEMTLKRGEKVIKYKIEDIFKNCKTIKVMSYWQAIWDALMGV